MEIATIIFTYNRPYHTKRVLEALQVNDITPTKLIIFQDGMKKTTNVDEWKKVGQVIRAVKWCNTELHIASENKGLAESIISGVTYALEKYDAVIVLEDDCVPHPKFMSYMVSGLKKYKDKKQVYSIGGCSWPISLQKKKEDVFFCGRICSVGWGIWRDRWEQYERDYMLLKKIKKDNEAKKRLEIWGPDLEFVLAGNIAGKYDSWAVFWDLKVIEKGGYCLVPYESLIDNIGFDGTGRHCGAEEIGIKCRAVDNMDDLVLPDVIQSCEEAEEEVQFIYGGKHGEEKMKYYQDMLLQWMQMKQLDISIQLPDNLGDSIAVWGKGRIFDCLYREIKNQFSVKYIIESIPSISEYNGIPVISMEELPNNIKDIIVIPYFDLDLIKAKVKKIRPDVQLMGIDELFR